MESIQRLSCRHYRHSYIRAIVVHRRGWVYSSRPRRLWSVSCKPTEMQCLSQFCALPFCATLEDDVFSNSTHLLRGVDGHLHAIAQFLAGLSHGLGDIGSRERVWIDVDIESLVFVLNLRASGLVDDAQIEGVDRETGQARTQLIGVQLVQCPGARQQSGTASVGKADLLAREDSRVTGVVRGEDCVGCIPSHTQWETDAQLSWHIWVGHTELSCVAVLVLEWGQSQDKVLRQLLDEILSGLFATGHVVHHTCGRGGGLLNGVPDAEELYKEMKRRGRNLSAPLFDIPIRNYVTQFIPLRTNTNSELIFPVMS